MLIIARRTLIGIFLLLSSSYSVADESVIGQWTTIDDETNAPRSVVELYMKGDKLYGDIKDIFYREGEDESGVCDKCSKDDERYGQKILGMTIVSGLKKNAKNGKWEGGKILDPGNGKTYKCAIWLEDGELKVRGYIAFLYRTQTWKKPK